MELCRDLKKRTVTSVIWYGMFPSTYIWQSAQIHSTHKSMEAIMMKQPLSASKSLQKMLMRLQHYCMLRTLNTIQVNTLQYIGK